ncbi:hypothetical protein BBJ28_00017004, partial [Nothophytophthora sp. Chile5]
MEAAAKAFEQHVEMDEGVLATSAPLEISQLDRVILQVRVVLPLAEVEAIAAEDASSTKPIAVSLPSSADLQASSATAASDEKLAPIFAKQARKRPLEKTSTTESGAEEKRPKASGSSERPASEAAPPLRSVLTEETVYQTAEEKAKATNPAYTVPTQWEELYYRKVEVINVNNCHAKEQIEAKRFAGEPFLLEGHTGWLKFADGWVKPDGTLDTTAFLTGIHDVKVPVLERNYEERNPIKTYLPLSYYVKNYWEHGKSDYYMHQWQFPLDPKAGQSLCYKCEELPVIGDNLLLYWLDAVRGDNPLQYLFMGQKSTRSRMHLDPGGLGITIAPIIGTKRVTMLHRQAAKLDSVHETVNFHEVDLDKIPQLAF